MNVPLKADSGLTPTLIHIMHPASARVDDADNADRAAPTESGGITNARNVDGFVIAVPRVLHRKLTNAGMMGRSVQHLFFCLCKSHNTSHARWNRWCGLSTVC